MYPQCLAHVPDVLKCLLNDYFNYIYLYFFYVCFLEFFSEMTICFQHINHLLKIFIIIKSSILQSKKQTIMLLKIFPLLHLKISILKKKTSSNMTLRHTLIVWTKLKKIISQMESFISEIVCFTVT